MRTTERSRQRGFAMPLALRLFLGTALLIGFAVGAAVLVTYLQGKRIADQAVGKALTTSAAVQREFEQRRLEQLQLAARLIAADAGFVKYIADAAGSNTLPGLGGDSAPDTGSMRDLLGERQKDFGLDLAILLDARGEVLARTDESEAFKSSLAQDPLVAPAVRDAAPFSGYWRLGDRLFQAAVIPVAQDQDLVGFLLVALAVNDELSKSVAQVSGAQIAFWLPRDDGAALVASSFDAAVAGELKQAVSAQRAELLPALQAGKTLDHVPLHLGAQDWIARFAPTAAPGEGQLGTVAVLSSADQIVGSYSAILNWVILAGLASIAVALLLSFVLARRILRPIGTMARAAESAAAGDYQTRIGTGGSDALGRLAKAFDTLLSDLREKSDMEGYVGHLSRFLPEPTTENAPSPSPARAATPTAPRRDTLALLGVEFRHLLGAPTPMHTPEQVAAEFAGARALLEAVAHAHGAELGAAGGARWQLGFGGPRRLLDAAGAWARIVDDCARARIVVPAGALAEGDVVLTSGAGAVEVLTLGAATAQLDRLLCDAAPGQLLMTRAAGDAIKSQLSPDALAVAEGVFSSKRYYALAAAAIPQLTADAAATVVRPRLALSPKAADRGALALGTTLGGRYRITAALGAGGMGVVYKAHDLELDDVVALKMLRPGVLLDGEQLDRLKSEIKLARKITHPNVLRTFDFGEVDGRPYISMEYVRGLTLRYLLSETERVPYSAALRIARQLSAGLAAAHEVGVLHRDIKPENLILEANGNAKLMDFGIARPSLRVAPGHTQPGTFIGTPNYCAPEQLTGDDVDERGDIYACGVVMSEMFCGGLPFSGANTMEIYQLQMRDEPITPSQLWPEIPIELEAVILRCLRRDREDRYATARDLNAALTDLRA
jgi:eukaryotic-like serine/threonine-protein kinase